MGYWLVLSEAERNALRPQIRRHFLACFSIFFSSYFSAVLALNLLRRYCRLWFSKYLERHRRNLTHSTSSFRVTFNDQPLVQTKKPDNHSHPVAAADRASAIQHIERIATLLGLCPYYVQRSRNDENSGRLGSREYYWAKDVEAKTGDLLPPDNALISLVDVDQYMDMSSFLTDHFRPVIIYTFQPTAVSRVSTNYSFTFDEKDQVHYSVVGGGKFLHQVWNYSGDSLTIYKHAGPWTYRATTYLIDRRTTSVDHDLILLTPIGQWSWTPAFIHELLLHSNPLTRLSVYRDGFSRLQVNSKDGVAISTGRTGQYLSTSVPIVVDEAIAGLARTSKYDITLPQVQALVGGPRENSVPLLDYHLTKGSAKPDQVYTVQDAVRTYQFYNNNYERYKKPTMRGFMRPIVHGCFSPARDLANEEECIRARIVDVRVEPLPVTKWMLNLIREFCDLLIPTPFLLHPTDYNEVLDRQDRPTQRRLLWQNMASLPKRLIQMFIKAEAYGNVKAPRPISVINPVDKREYSRFTYALEAIFKNQPWYAFSHTPAQIAARVVEILASANFATPTDFSKFDGHGSNIMRFLERAILMRAFAPQYHAEIVDLHNSQFNLEAYGVYASWYLTYFSRASGSPETSIFNTAFNAFIAYVAMRNSGRRPLDAFSGLGIYGGDDGLTADVEQSSYVKAAKSVGQELTIETIKRGSFGIKFLARVYGPDVWTGDSSSCCDLMRQLSKIHATVSLPGNVTPIEKLSEKIRAFSLTDSETPVIGELCKRFISIRGALFASDKTLSMRTWLSKFDMTVQYPNGPAQWMHDYLDEMLPEFDLRRFRTWLAGCRRDEDFLNPPVCKAPVEPKVDKLVVVDDILYPLNAVPLPAPSAPIERKHDHPHPEKHTKQRFPGWDDDEAFPVDNTPVSQVCSRGVPHPHVVLYMMRRYPGWDPAKFSLANPIVKREKKVNVSELSDVKVAELMNQGPDHGKGPYCKLPGDITGIGNEQTTTQTKVKTETTTPPPPAPGPSGSGTAAAEK